MKLSSKCMLRCNTIQHIHIVLFTSEYQYRNCEGKKRGNLIFIKTAKGFEERDFAISNVISETVAFIITLEHEETLELF